MRTKVQITLDQNRHLWMGSSKESPRQRNQKGQRKQRKRKGRIPVGKGQPTAAKNQQQRGWRRPGRGLARGWSF